MRQLLKLLFILLAAAGISGCSGLRLAYNNADTVVRWMADDYFSIEGAQQEDFMARLARFHAWHRSEELPRYSVLLTGAGQKLADGLTAQELMWAWDNVWARYRRMAAQAAPELALVLPTLTPAQFEHAEKRFAESRTDFAKKYLKGSEADQRERRDKRTLELMQEWFGSLSDGQEAQIKLASARLPLLYSLRLQNRQRRQSEFIAMLKAYRSPEELEPRLARWLIEWEEGASPEYRRLSDLHREMYIQMLLELDRSLTPEQRAHAVTRLNDYSEVFASLVSQGKPSRPGP
jgi:hypothetical protein